ncbi:MAG: hypothetical protein DMF63_04325 [Acidobacteria bacterium]|nr:MAG: hypothetical protein DMF63_04325 [Acidobacteriota bacterium]
MKSFVLRKGSAKEETMVDRLEFVFLLLLVVFASGCRCQPGERDYRELERLPASERSRAFSSYSTDRQIDVYLFSENYVEGGVDTYFRYLADNVEGNKAEIAQRIQKTSSFKFKTDLIRLLDFADQRCGCVSADAELMAVLRANEKPVESDDREAVRGSKNLYSRCLERIVERNL